MRNLPKFIFSVNLLYFITVAAQCAAIVFLCFYIPSFLPSALAFAGLWLVNAAAAAALFARRGEAEAKCAWFVLITALPVAGAVIFLLSSVKKKPCGVFEITGAQTDGLARAANGTCGAAEVGYDGAVYFDCGEKLLNAMLCEIERAEKSVYIEFFIVKRGLIFSRLAAALERAAENGAEIKIIIDGFGSAFGLGRRQLKRLKKTGAEIKIFNRITPFPRAGMNLRDHRKIVAVDGEVAFTGGVNIADEYANITSPHGYWKDGGVAVYGAAAKVLEGMFLSVMRGGYKMSLPAGGERTCLPFCDSPPYRAFCEDAYAFALHGAKRRAHIMTPYFCVSEKTAAALRLAALRGVDVKIILPHVPDKKYAFEISKAYAKPLSECGVKFYEYTPGFMHAKCFVCDGAVFLGSYNFDFRSTHYNYECGIMFTGDICEQAERDFEACLALSAPLEEGKISAPRRLYRFLLKLFSPLI